VAGGGGWQQQQQCLCSRSRVLTVPPGACNAARDMLTAHNVLCMALALSTSLVAICSAMWLLPLLLLLPPGTGLFLLRCRVLLVGMWWP
jgi:hypothetical protein